MLCARALPFCAALVFSFQTAYSGHGAKPRRALPERAGFAGRALSPPPSNEPTSSTVSVPFDLFLKKSLNPLDFYRGKTVPPVNMSNSARLIRLIRDGKIYLTLRDAIDLALEDNLDMVIARYNLPIAQLDVSARFGRRFSARRQYRRCLRHAGRRGLSAEADLAPAPAAPRSAPAVQVRATAGLVQSTLGGGSSVSNFDPYITVQSDVDHITQSVNNQVLYGVPVVHQNTRGGGTSLIAQAFPTGGSIQATWNNSRETFNSPNYAYNPQYYSFGEFYIQQPLLAGFGFGPNLRYLRIASTNKKVSDIAFRAQVIATVTQICNIYWDLVAAYDTAQVNQRSVDFARKRSKKVASSLSCRPFRRPTCSKRRATWLHANRT